MYLLISYLLAKQIVLALERADAPNLQNTLEGERKQISRMTNNPRASRSTVALGSNFTIKLGALFGGVTLLFFMGLIIMSVFGRGVPTEGRYLVVIVLALSGALSAAFLGGNASARGVIPLKIANE